MNEDIANWLRAMPDWAGARVERLDGGRSNRAFRLTTGARSAVLKLDEAPRRWPGNGRAGEARVQQAAAAAGLAAPVLWHSELGILTDWLDDRPLDSDRVGAGDALHRIGRALGELHALPQSGYCFELAGWADHYRRKLEAHGRYDARAGAAWRLLSGAVLPGPTVLSHNDLVPANILLGEGVRFIDWEYAADNSWLFDFATLYVEAGLDERAALELFTAYAGDRSIPEGFSAAVDVYRALVTLWELSRLPAIA